MVFEGIPGGPMDCWSDVKTPAEHLAKSKWILETFLPWEAERCRSIELTDDNGILAGSFAPTVDAPIGRLPSGALVLGLADTVCLNDPDHRPGLEQRLEGRQGLYGRDRRARRQAVRRRLHAGDVRRLLGLCAIRDRLDQRPAAAAAARMC